MESYSKNNILNDIDIANIYYNYDKKYLVIVYANSNVDILHDNGNVFNIPDIKNAILTTAKGINDVKFYGDRIYLATDFGIVVLNDKKNDKNSGVSDEGTSEQKDIETDNTIENSTASTAESESAETGASGVSNDSLHYDPKDSISWPINGNVIIPYSMDTTVYFETLKEYKCSPAMVIEAQTGDEVKAVYESKVAEVSSNPELGNYVKLELGDGYTVTLGQLQDVKVALGEHLDAGQVVGTVGEPSRFYSEEGSNLYFAVEKDGNPVDPMLLIQ